MTRQMSDKELKRFGKVLAGHEADKDRARWKRKHKGAGAARERSRKAGDELESIDEALAEAAEDEPDGGR